MMCDLRVKECARMQLRLRNGCLHLDGVVEDLSRCGHRRHIWIVLGGCMNGFLNPSDHVAQCSALLCHKM